MRIQTILALGAVGLLLACNRESEPEDSSTREAGALHTKPSPEASLTDRAPENPKSREELRAVEKKPPANPPQPLEQPLPLLSSATSMRLDSRGVGALIRAEAKKGEYQRPLSWVRHLEGEEPEKLLIGPQFYGITAANTLAGRVVLLEGRIPNQKLTLWEKGESVRGPTGIFKGGALAQSDAVILTGRMDKQGRVARANGRVAHLYRDKKWRELSLPGPPEKFWAKCFWDARARPESDDLVLLQICRAPGREFAYAFYRLEDSRDELRRLDFDNSLFPDRRMARGHFGIEEDGTINMSSLTLGVKGAVTYVRRRAEGESWKRVWIPHPKTSVMLNVAFFGQRVFLSSGKGKLWESNDDGASFSLVSEKAPEGFLVGGCSAQGCLMDGHEPETVLLRRWSLAL